MATDEDIQHERWNTESRKVPTARVREVVTEEMWQHVAEKRCMARFGLSLQAAIYLVCRAGNDGIIGMSRGMVRPEVKPCTCPLCPCPRHND